MITLWLFLKSMLRKNFVCDILDKLALPLHCDKLTPNKRLTCLGIVIDIDTNTMSISENKLKSIHDECINVNTRTWLSKRTYQSLLEKLLYIQKCGKPFR